MDYTPNDFIDLTVLNTPKPQAASTVERKSIHSFRPNSNNIDVNNYQYQTNNKAVDIDIPTRDTDVQSTKSGKSSISSLGLLPIDNVSDISSQNQIQDVNNAQKKYNINERLEMQRLLALKAMDKIDAKNKNYVGGLPSYLLKATETPGRSNTINTITPTKSESTINLSDLERSMPKFSNTTDKLSFETSEISARSSSIGNQNNNENLKILGTIDLSSPPLIRSISNDFTAKCQSICDRMRKSDMSLAALCDRSSKLGVHTEPLGPLPLPEIETIDLSSNSSCNSWCPEMQDSLVAKLQNELFTPAELATNKLLEDEISWRKAKDVIPIDSYNKDHLDLSCFSGYIDADSSLRSRNNDKASMSDFFKQRSENVSDLNLKTSPVKKHEAVALINETVASNKSEDINNENSLRISDIPRVSTDQSILSATRIADAVSKMSINDTPTRVLDLLLKKVPSKPPRTSLAQTLSSDSSTLKNTQYSKTETPSTLKNTQICNTPDTLSQMKENSYSNNTKMHSDKVNTDNILRDSTNIPDVISDKYIATIKIDDDGWTDAKPNVECVTENNGTISSITDSPSYSCSELDFSEDERSESTNGRRQTDILTDDWILIEQTEQQIKSCVYIPEDITLTIKSKSNHWLHLRLNIKNISSDNYKDKIADINITNEQSVLKSYANDQLHFTIKCLVTGKIVITLTVEITDMVTKMQKIIEHIVIIECEKIKITISNELLDFKMLPEGAIKRETLTISNHSRVALPLTLEIVQDLEYAFLFASCAIDEDDDKNNKLDLADIKRLINLPAGGKIQIPIDMCAPQLEGLTSSESMTLKGTLRISLTDEIGRGLNKVQLYGKVGLTKVQFKSSCMPFKLLPGETKQLQVRNSGIISLELSVNIYDEENNSNNSNNSNGFFTIDTNNIVLKPGQIGTINISFNIRDRINGPIKGSVSLEYYRGPSFVLAIEGIPDSKSLEVKRSPNVHSPNVRSNISRSPNIRSPTVSRSPRIERSNSTGSRSTSSQSSDSGGTLSCLQDGKLPIESTKTELVWGCVKPGKNNSQEFLLRNRCSQRVRLQAVIQGSACFKFVKDTESTTSITLVLHSLESRTIAVNFCPTCKGAARARLMFLPIDQEVVNSKRQMIQLYGYGGHTCVDVQKVAKDTSGRMWLSFGRLDYRQTLHQVFILRNTGTLSAFACLSVSCKVLYPFMDSSVRISPTEIVIEPNKEIEVTIEFTPRPEDFKYIQKTGGIEVSEIASIRILTGPEPTRGRIRRLFNKINSGTHGSLGNTIISQLSNNFLVPRLSGTFPGERMPADILGICRESSSGLRDLLRDIDTRDLILTIERDMDAECAALDNPVDDTCLFQSLVCGNGTVNETLAPTGRPSGGFCTVEPRKIILTPPLEPHGTLLVRSHHSRQMPYEVCLPQQALDAGIQVSPQVGVLAAGEVALLTCTATRVLQRSPYICIFMVYVENEVMEIEVKILNAQSRAYK